MRDKQTSGGGIGLCGILTIVFIVLKLTGVIAWSWLRVLAPIWIPVSALMVYGIIYAVCAVIKEG